VTPVASARCVRTSELVEIPAVGP